MRWVLSWTAFDSIWMFDGGCLGAAVCREAQARETLGLRRHLYRRSQQGRLPPRPGPGDRQVVAADAGGRGGQSNLPGHPSRPPFPVRGQRSRQLRRQERRGGQCLRRRSGNRQADAPQPAVLRRRRPVLPHAGSPGQTCVGRQLRRRQCLRAADPARRPAGRSDRLCAAQGRGGGQATPGGAPRPFDQPGPCQPFRAGGGPRPRQDPGVPLRRGEGNAHAQRTPVRGPRPGPVRAISPFTPTASTPTSSTR